MIDREKTWTSARNGDINYEFTTGCEGHKLRVKVLVNSYAHQSWARCDRWDGGQWQEVCSIDHSLWPEETRDVRKNTLRGHTIDHMDFHEISVNLLEDAQSIVL